jgi:hypothetical protein
VLERLGKVCGWAGTGLALLIVVWGFLTWHAGHGGPLYFGVLAAVAIFSLGRRFATSLPASHLTDNYRNPVSRCEDRSSYVPQANVRFESKGDMCAAKSHVRFTPDSDIDCVFS